MVKLWLHRQEEKIENPVIDLMGLVLLSFMACAIAGGLLNTLLTKSLEVSIITVAVSAVLFLVTFISLALNEAGETIYRVAGIGVASSFLLSTSTSYFVSGPVNQELLVYVAYVFLTGVSMWLGVSLLVVAIVLSAVRFYPKITLSNTFWMCAQFIKKTVHDVRNGIHILRNGTEDN